MKCLAIFWTALSIAGCTAPPAEKPNEPNGQGTKALESASISERELGVVRAMLEYETRGQKEPKPVIILFAESLGGGLGLDAASQTNYASAIRDFQKANRRRYIWPHDLDSRYDIHFLTSAQEAEIWRDRNGWDRFYQTFPKAHGFTTLSRAGFSADGRLALVYRGCQSESLAGSMRIFVLRFERGNWRVTSERLGLELLSMSSCSDRTGIDWPALHGGTASHPATPTLSVPPRLAPHPRIDFHSALHDFSASWNSPLNL